MIRGTKGDGKGLQASFLENGNILASLFSAPHRVGGLSVRRLAV